MYTGRIEIVKKKNMTAQQPKGQGIRMNSTKKSMKEKAEKV
jgi:hypothetical protein